MGYIKYRPKRPKAKIERELCKNLDNTLFSCKIESEIASENKGLNRAQITVSNDMDDMDDTLHIIKGDDEKNR